MLLFLLPVLTMSDDKKIEGAPTWVHEFLERVESRDAVRNEIEDQAHKATLNAISELAETVGQIAGSLARLERKVETQRQEIRITRDKMSVLEEELRLVHNQIDGLNERVQGVEEQIKTFQAEAADGEDPAPETP